MWKVAPVWIRKLILDLKMKNNIEALVDELTNRLEEYTSEWKNPGHSAQRTYLSLIFMRQSYRAAMFPLAKQMGVSADIKDEEDIMDEIIRVSRSENLANTSRLEKAVGEWKSLLDLWKKEPPEKNRNLATKIRTGLKIIGKAKARPSMN